MALTTTNIIPRKLAETAATVQYTATGVTTVIDKFTVTNTTSQHRVYQCLPAKLWVYRLPRLT
jgi:hypothetical protein